MRQPTPISLFIVLLLTASGVSAIQFLPSNLDTATAEATNVVVVPDVGLQLTPSTPLPLYSGGNTSTCVPRTAFYPLADDYTIRFTVTPTTWPSGSGTVLASATNQWSLQTNSGILVLNLPKSPSGGSGYNKQLSLGASTRLLGSPHTFTLQNRGQELSVFLDGELRGILRHEYLRMNPGSTGKLCIGSSWPLTVHDLSIKNGTSHNQTTYNSPNPYTIFPGRLSLSPIPVTPTSPVYLDATVTSPTAGTQVLLEPRWVLADGTTTDPLRGKAASLVVMACGVSSQKNHTAYDALTAAFAPTHQTYTCVISDSSYNKTATAALATAGMDVGLEYDPSNCAGLSAARTNWLVNRGITPTSFVNYFGIMTEPGLACAAQYGLTWLNNWDSDNTAYFRTLMRSRNCGYKADQLKCFEDDLKTTQDGDWTVFGIHWNEKNQNDSLYTDLVEAASKAGVPLKSVHQVQTEQSPELGQGPLTLNPPENAVAFAPVLVFYSDGTHTPTLTELSITQTSSPPPPPPDCVPNMVCDAWPPCIDGISTRNCDDGCGRTSTQSAACTQTCTWTPPPMNYVP